NHEEAVSRGVSWEQRSLFVLSGYLITGIPVPAPGGIPSALLLAALSPHLSSVLRHDRPRVCDVASRSSIDDKLSASPKASRDCYKRCGSNTQATRSPPSASRTSRGHRELSDESSGRVRLLCKLSRSLLATTKLNDESDPYAKSDVPGKVESSEQPRRRMTIQ